MKIDVTQAPVGLPISWESLKRRLVLNDPEEEQVVMELAGEATAHAEHLLQSSLCYRTLTATYYDHNDAVHHNYHFDGFEELPLRRGPVDVVISVKDKNDVDVSYEQIAKGYYEAIRLRQRVVHYPVTVVYTAGYDELSNIPADILGAIRTDTTTRYLFREEYQLGKYDRINSLDEFYRARSRGVPIA